MKQKNIALLIAGGSGKRMQQEIPKQFLNVYDKPVIIYTLEAFQNHPDIDAIVVVCLSGWEEILRAYSRQFNITKLTDIVVGGETGQESIKNGILSINEKFDQDDFVMVHDGNRPLISTEIISNNLASAHLHGSAVTAINCAEAILETDDHISSRILHDRKKLMRTQTPQTFKLKQLLWAHNEAAKKGINNSVATCTLFIELGQEVFFSAGSEKNIKLTTPDDMEIFKALLNTKKDEWMK